MASKKINIKRGEGDGEEEEEEEADLNFKLRHNILSIWNRKQFGNSFDTHREREREG